MEAVLAVTAVKDADIEAGCKPDPELVVEEHDVFAKRATHRFECAATDDNRRDVHEVSSEEAFRDPFGGVNAFLDRRQLRAEYLAAAIEEHHTREDEAALRVLLQEVDVALQELRPPAIVVVESRDVGGISGPKRAIGVLGRRKLRICHGPGDAWIRDARKLVCGFAAVRPVDRDMEVPVPVRLRDDGLDRGLQVPRRRTRRDSDVDVLQLASPTPRESTKCSFIAHSL